MSRVPRIHPIPVPTPFPVGPVNTYLVTGSPLILVDTGPNTDDAHAALTRALASHKVSFRDLEVILLTHAHIDHVGLLGRILEESDAETYAHPEVVARSARRDHEEHDIRDFTIRVMRELGVPEDGIAACAAERENYRPYGSHAVIGHSVEDSGRIHDYAVYHVPGHSAHDTLFVDHDRRRAFSGDHILKSISPNPLLRRPAPGQSRPKSLVEFRRSLQRTRQLDLEVCYPGHGDPIRNHREIIDNLFHRQDKRSQRVLDILGDTTMTPYEVCCALFPDLKTEFLYLGISSSVGHLELLEEEGRAVSKTKNGVVRYARA